MPGPFHCSDGHISILGVGFEPYLQLEWNWPKVQVKVEEQVGTWFWMRLSLKDRAEECATYVFSLNLYWRSVLPLPGCSWLALQQSLSKLLWGGWKPMVHRQVCYQRLYNGGLRMPDLEGHYLAERLAFLSWSSLRDAVWRHKVKEAFLHLRSNPKTKSCCRLRGETPFLIKCLKALYSLPGSSNLSQSRKDLYWELMVGSTRGATRFIAGGDWLPMKLETRFWLLERLWLSGLFRTCCLFPAWLSKQAWQTYLIVPAVAVVEEKWVDCLHRFQTVSAASCWWIMLTLCGKVRNVWCFSWS